MADWEDTGQSYWRSGPQREDNAGLDPEHLFANRSDEWRRIRDTAYAGVPGQDEGIQGPGPYYPEYQISGQVVHPGRDYGYELDPGATLQRRERHGGWAEEGRVSWQRPARRWTEEHLPRGWRRISRGHAVGHPPEAWTRPGSMSLTTGGVGGHYGRGPKNYVRSDERIREDVCDKFMSTDRLDCGDVEISVDKGEVTLNGTVHDRQTKHYAEDLAADVLGVKDVHNHLRVASPTASR